MALFEKIAKIFRRPSAGEPAAVPVNHASPVSSPIVDAPEPRTQPVLTPPPPTDPVSLKKTFLEELRSIPVRQAGTESARDEFLRELRRLGEKSQEKP